MTHNHSASCPTLKDVAEAAGVSRTTVSNAFNRPDQLSEELRGRILETARKLGYCGPHPVARVLRTGRAGAIGLLFPGSLPYAFDDPTTLAFLQGVGKVCERFSSALLLLPVLDNPAAIETVQQSVVDGFLIYSLPDPRPAVDRVLERRLPVVAVDQAIMHNIVSVNIDDRGAACEAAEHLLDLGHRRLAIMALDLIPDGHSGPFDLGRRQLVQYSVTAQRLRGYEDALKNREIDLNTVYFWECPNNHPRGAYQAATQLLRQEPRPTGILAMSDRMAIGVLEAARDLGIDVPRELSVVGFDDIPLVSQHPFALTTVHQPSMEKGEIAAELLLNRAQGASRLLPTKLLVRASTGPVPA